MKKSKITSKLSKLSDADLEARSFGIVAAITGNPHFTESTPTLADLNNSIKLFSDSLALATSGDRVKAIYKNQQRNNLEGLLDKLSNYCSFIAQGDRFILASSGFTINAETSASTTLVNPTNFTVEVGNKAGNALVYVKPVPNAKAYIPLGYYTHRK